MAGWIGIDLDGTLATYQRWEGSDHFGDVLEPMKIRIQQWLDNQIEVRIFTARASQEKNIAPLQAWLVEQGLGELAVTNTKDYDLLQIWDDRAVEVEANTGNILTPKEYISLHHQGWIGVELDGTLAHHTDGSPADEIGEPVRTMMSRVKQWAMVEMKLKLFTARANDPAQVEQLRAWLDSHGLVDMGITAEKDFQMSQFWDSRAVHVPTNTGQTVTQQAHFVPPRRYS